MRMPIWSVALTVALASVACSKSNQRSAEQAQLEADQRRIQLPQQQANQNQAAAAEAEAAQKRADQERADAERALAKDKADYVAKVQHELDTSRDTVSAIDDARMNAKGTARETQERVYSRVTSAKRMLNDDVGAIQNASQSEWPGIKAKVDRDIDVYHEAVSDADEARRKVIAPAAQTRGTASSGTTTSRTTTTSSKKAGLDAGTDSGRP